MDSKVTLVTVTYNSSHVLRNFWGGWDSSAAEWIVVDNASTDGSADVASELGATRVIRSVDNLGFAKANNLALKLTDTPYVGFVNPDITIDVRNIDRMIAHLQEFGGIAAPQLIHPGGELQPNGRGRPTLYAKLRNRVVDANPKYHLLASPGQCREVSWLMGAAVFAKTADFASIGGWNERYFIYYEDAELGLRAARHGLRVTVCGSARAIHGWARETTSIKFSPWKREFSSARTFYSSHLSLFFPHQSSSEATASVPCTHE